jgi:L-2-hydroxyglutarate oxidase
MSGPMPGEREHDIAIIGGGVLGVSMAFWLSSLYECRICLIEMEEGVGRHATTRNTGVIHRPFYLHPRKKLLFARSAQKSYFLWRRLAQRFGASWSQVGTLEVANSEPEVAVIQQYEEWALKNGVQQEELEILDPAGVRVIEPEVRCSGAIHSKSDTGVYFGELTRLIFSLAERNGVRLYPHSRVASLEEESDGLRIELRGERGEQSVVKARLGINAAGGASLDIAHALSLATGYTDLHFRGEYWRVGGEFANKVRRNVYSVPRNRDFPFLDPHFVVRADAQREIGPNAVLVAGPYAYRGFGTGPGEMVSKVLEKPMAPKARLFINPKFLSLIASEWQSSLSKKAMCARVARFIPNLKAALLGGRGVAGVRSSLIDQRGFVPEAVEAWGEHSLHILNFNSPGATGAPAFSAHEVARLRDMGMLSFRKRATQAYAEIWDYDRASDFEDLQPS